MYDQDYYYYAHSFRISLLINLIRFYQIFRKKVKGCELEVVTVWFLYREDEKRTTILIIVCYLLLSCNMILFVTSWLLHCPLFQNGQLAKTEFIGAVQCILVVFLPCVQNRNTTALFSASSGHVAPI